MNELNEFFMWCLNLVGIEHFIGWSVNDGYTYDQESFDEYDPDCFPMKYKRHLITSMIGRDGSPHDYLPDL
jgi:hypothetical protein